MHIVAKIPDDSDSQKNEWFPDFFFQFIAASLLCSEVKLGAVKLIFIVRTYPAMTWHEVAYRKYSQGPG